MAWPTDKTGAAAVWSDIQAIVDALTGVSGGGDQVQLIQYNNSSNYALDVRNLDTTNSYGLRVRDASSNNLLLAYKNNITLGASAANDSLTLNTNISGKVFIGDSANINLTVGLTINQAGNDDQAFALKSSDVAHGVTGTVETDTYLEILKAVAASGGARIRCYSSASRAFVLHGIAATDVTTKTTAATGYLEIQAAKVNGTGVQDAGADANLFIISNNGTCRFIFDAEGSAHANVGWVTYDEHDDLALLNQLDAAMTADPVKTEFGRFLGDYRQRLQEAKIVNFYDDGPRAMVNWTRLAMLMVGALRQVGQRLALVETKMKALPGGN